jgi:regulatory protein YycI of two-component signal transduction system YycFG
VRKKELNSRIQSAFVYAKDAVYDGEHHKVWVIDQMVRALTGCQLVTKNATAQNGQVYDYQGQGESPEYNAFRAANPHWDEGVAP